MLTKLVLSVFPGDLILDCSILKANVFILKNLVLMTKTF